MTTKKRIKIEITEENEKKLEAMLQTFPLFDYDENGEIDKVDWMLALERVVCKTMDDAEYLLGCDLQHAGAVKLKHHMFGYCTRLAEKNRQSYVIDLTIAHNTAYLRGIKRIPNLLEWKSSHCTQFKFTKKQAHMAIKEFADTWFPGVKY